MKIQDILKLNEAGWERGDLDRDEYDDGMDSGTENFKESLTSGPFKFDFNVSQKTTQAPLPRGVNPRDPQYDRDLSYGDAKVSLTAFYVPSIKFQLSGIDTPLEKNGDLARQIIEILDNHAQYEFDDQAYAKFKSQILSKLAGSPALADIAKQVSGYFR